MPLRPGEVSLLTVYGDLHYYFSPPNAKPLHHRLDRRSYVYLYHDALNRRGRLEIANHAGTPDQDAFDGYLDTADIEYSYKQPTLFTLTVQGRILQNPSPSPSPQQDMSQWHLPNADVRGDGKYMYKIHTIDLYLWTVEDASLFLDSLKRVLAPGQLRILDANNTHPEHRDSMSPVVQQLEKVAITTPGYAPQQHRSNSISTTHTTHSNAPGVGAIQTPVSPPSSPPVEQQQAPPQPAAFAPMAYNPAAPAAPEPIAHREKTPPPPDAEGGTGLNAAATHEHGAAAMAPGAHQQYGNPLQQQFAPQPSAVNPLQQQFTPQPSGAPLQQQFTPQQASNQFPGPPSMGPPGQPGIQRANTIGQPPAAAGAGQPPQSPFSQTFTAPPADPNAHLYGQQPPAPSPSGLARQNTLPSGQYPAQQPQYASYPSSFGPTALPSPGVFQGQQPQALGAPQAQQQQPYNPSLTPQSQQPQQAYGAQQGHGVSHAMHQQVYIPEGQANAAQAGPGQPAATGGFEQRMGKVEKGVGRFLKKLDKRL